MKMLGVGEYKDENFPAGSSMGKVRNCTPQSPQIPVDGSLGRDQSQVKEGHKHQNEETAVNSFLDLPTNGSCCLV